MKLKLNLYSLFLVVNTCFVCASAYADSISVVVENNWSKPKYNEPVVLTSNEIPFLNSGENIVVMDGDKIIPVQLDDLNSDSEYDELVFVADIPAKDSKTFIIKTTEEKITYTPRVHAQMMINDKKSRFPHISSMTVPGTTKFGDIYDALYHHGPAFESELVGFRVYFDNRQSVDIYGKKHKRLELSETNFYTTAKQKSEGYGCDILWAGTSIGLGSFRGWSNNNYVTLDSVESRTGGVLAYGPVRTVVEFKDKDWVINGRVLNISQRYVLYSGHRDVNVSIDFKGDTNNMLFCTGVQKLEKNNTGFVSENGLAGSWGRNFPDKNDTINNKIETLGLGINVPTKFVNKTVEETNNYLILVNPKNNTLDYNIIFFSEKEENGMRGSKEWFGYLKEWREGLNTPCKVYVKK